MAKPVLQEIDGRHRTFHSSGSTPLGSPTESGRCAYIYITIIYIYIYMYIYSTYKSYVVDETPLNEFHNKKQWTHCTFGRSQIWLDNIHLGYIMQLVQATFSLLKVTTIPPYGGISLICIHLLLIIMSQLDFLMSIKYSWTKCRYTNMYMSRPSIWICTLTLTSA